MIETFTAETALTNAEQDYKPELARLAAAWFETTVRCIALDVTMNAESGRLVARGTFVPDSPPSRSRAESVARWLGLVRGPGQPPASPPVLP